MPSATAAMGKRICIDASRAFIAPVQVSKEFAAHSLNGVASARCTSGSLFRRHVSQMRTGMPTATRKNNVTTMTVTPAYVPRLNSAHTDPTSQIASTTIEP